MKLYLSFGFVADDGQSTRLFYQEQDVSEASLGGLVQFVMKYLKDLV